MSHSLIGVDEVGTGAWAGPLLVVAARQLADLPAGVRDSKLMTKVHRLEILNKLSICCEFGTGWVSANEIDHHGLAEAMRLGVSRALKTLRSLPIEETVIDGKVDYADRPNSRAVIDADAKYPIVSAASIYAKVLRDKYMSALSKEHPGYGFEKHVGYGTEQHKQALIKYGAIKDVHRFSFKPVADLAK